LRATREKNAFVVNDYIYLSTMINPLSSHATARSLPSLETISPSNSKLKKTIAKKPSLKSTSSTSNKTSQASRSQKNTSSSPLPSGGQGMLNDVKKQGDAANNFKEALQKLQQKIEMRSAVQATLHQILMSIIRNLRLG
jgi:hypothetical protein